MHTSIDCIPCLVRHALDAARFVSADPQLHESVVRDVLRMIMEMDLAESPPAITQRLQRRIRLLTGSDDPYRDLKRHANETVAAAVPHLSEQVHAADDPLLAAVRLAIAGNTIDAGARGRDSVARIEEELASAQERPFHGDVDELRQAASSADSILYLTDNTGEIVLDRLLAEQLPNERITFAVRGAPVLNDATLDDARFAGLESLAPVIDNGSDAPGTILADCSAEFRGRFAAADLIIAKGQGNFETLSDERADIFFLFTVKCDIAARHAGLPRGTQALLRSPTAGSPPH